MTAATMPPAYYHRFGLHAAAKLSAADQQALAAGLAIADSPPPGGVSTRRGDG